MNLDEKEAKFLEKKQQIQDSSLYHPLVMICMFISYTFPFFMFFLRVNGWTENNARIFMALYWAGGIFLALILFRERKKFLKIIDKLSE